MQINGELNQRRAVGSRALDWPGPSVKDYLSEIRATIKRNFGCVALHAQSVSVKKVLADETPWDGTVEIFDLVGHTEAKRCYAWGHPKEGSDEWVVTTVLEVPSVVSAEAAVKTVFAKAVEKQASVQDEK